MPLQNLLNPVVAICVYLFLLFCVPSSYVFSQHHTSLGSSPLENKFQKALSLFEEQHYEAAQKTFSTYLSTINTSTVSQNQSNQKLEALYYLRLCELYLKKPYSEANSIEFIDTYQRTIYADNLKLALANFFYEEANY